MPTILLSGRFARFPSSIVTFVTEILGHRQRLSLLCSRWDLPHINTAYVCNTLDCVCCLLGAARRNVLKVKYITTSVE
jgi:DMSO/TMAO reductase YedYZ heme-binding membrane subunit